MSEVLSDCALFTWSQPYQGCQGVKHVGNWQNVTQMALLKRKGKRFLGSPSMSVYESLTSVCRDWQQQLLPRCLQTVMLPYRILLWKPTITPPVLD